MPLFLQRSPSPTTNAPGISSTPPWYRNSLLASTGYLEFANAGDFAANVWNEIPVPRHALILMAIGGPLALLMSVVALRDGLLSWQNVQLLRTERRFLHRLKREYCEGSGPNTASNSDPDLLRLIDSRLGVGVRELGTELVDRIAMDVLLGVGALLVGTGTLMAIWGAHPRVFHASNLLSGFVGNAFAAAFGVVNAVWSAYLVVRYSRHEGACGGPAASSLAPFRPRLHRRFSRLRWHAVVSGATGLVAGAASMITAKRWWGYVILIPCMVLQVACNWLWRKHLGHDRPVVSECSWPGLGTPAGRGCEDAKATTVLLDQLAATVSLNTALGSLPSSTDRVEIDWSTLDSLVSFLVTHELFDSLCAWIAREKTVPEELRGMLFRVSPPENEISLSPRHFLRLPVETHARWTDLIREFLQGEARAVLRSRERYLLEMVGWTMMTGAQSE